MEGGPKKAKRPLVRALAESMELMVTTLDSRPPATGRQPLPETLFQEVLGQFRAAVNGARELDERGWETFWSIVGIQADAARIECWTRGDE